MLEHQPFAAARPGPSIDQVLTGELLSGVRKTLTQ